MEKIGLGIMVWRIFIEKNEPIYALFDEDINIRGLAWNKEDLDKLRRKLKWGKECEIKKIKINWKEDKTAQ